MLKFAGDWEEFQAKTCLLRQLLTKYMKKTKEIKKNWIGKENIDI